MTQTWALLLDAYRELHSKRLFWISMSLSLLVVASFGCVGITSSGVSILFWDIPIAFFNSRVMSAATFYKLLFANLGIKFWLSWIGMILAVISTSGMFPDFVANGSIDLMLSKPISRWRLFLTKYAVGLLFVTLQVTVFSVASMLVIGIRGGAWEPRLLLAVPLVSAMFSFLFCVCALFGVVTRSTLWSLLFTLLFWLGLFGLHATDQVFIQLREHSAARQEQLELRIAKAERGTATALDRQSPAPSDDDAKTTDAPGKSPPARGSYSQAQLDEANPVLAMLRTRLVTEQSDLVTWTRWTTILSATRLALPKTTETVNLLETVLIKPGDIERFKAPDEDEGVGLGREDDVKVSRLEMRKRIEKLARSQPLSWILGTSFGFEAIVLGIAAWFFQRRDF